jgi:threonine dehydrogenase-like Zn-dependent dehydrogenase
MRSLTFTGPGSLEWREVAEPRVAGIREAIVRPLTIATCDLDAVIVRGEAPFPPPFAIGHEGIAEVVDIGEAVRSVAPGDRVVVPFQISCGDCRACREGRTGNCESVPPASTYGFGFGPEATRWGGFLADRVRVPYADAMLVPLPHGVDARSAASASDNLVDGYRCVAAPLAARPGAPVLVIGGASSGSIGLYAVAQAVALRSERVLYVDDDLLRLGIAAKIGAETREGIPDSLDGSFPITVEARGEVRALELAISSLSRDGFCTSAAAYFGEARMPALPMLALYVKGMTFTTGRIHTRRDLPRVLELLEGGDLDPTPVTTKVVDFDDAIDALVDGGYSKLLFEVSEGGEAESQAPDASAATR